MSSEDQRGKNTLPWIVAIAVSVLCCAAVFVIFAGYLDEIKMDMRENAARIDLIEKRQDALFTEFDGLYKRLAAQQADVAQTPPPPPASLPSADGASAPPPPLPNQEPPPPMPMVSPTTNATPPAPPLVAMPTMQAPPDKK